MATTPSRSPRLSLSTLSVLSTLELARRPSACKEPPGLSRLLQVHACSPLGLRHSLAPDGSRKLPLQRQRIGSLPQIHSALRPSLKLVVLGLQGTTLLHMLALSRQSSCRCHTISVEIGCRRGLTEPHRSRPRVKRKRRMLRGVVHSNRWQDPLTGVLKTVQRRQDPLSGVLKTVQRRQGPLTMLLENPFSVGQIHSRPIEKENVQRHGHVRSCSMLIWKLIPAQ
ncbi:hypothetical protein PMIN01_07659 [Paraphaeosphaeria minitans]|uniref:Uncharacterized protein n=1 Tax=Paraphaeosphaeria minitans TaxID=565426 RepID=A0A9P6KQE7_9PLEO|nr:hypothetical protein PMIN01_07659 [Paraphaeosphaeria minitans]